MQDVNANAVCVQIVVPSIAGVCNITLLNELAEAVNKVAQRYEAKGIDFSYSNFVLDKDGVAIY